MKNKVIRGVFLSVIFAALSVSANAQSKKDLAKKDTIPTKNSADTTAKQSAADSIRFAELNEVVVVAYGTQKKSSVTGAVAQISAKDIAKRPLANVADALAGAAPGIQSTLSAGQPGTTPDVRIRGFGSISAGSSPLIVLDGMVYDGDLASISPDDIASVSTLMDASAAALYGSRGSNGVILITTKHGSSKNRKPSVQFKMNLGNSTRMLPEYNLVNAYDYYPLMWEFYRNGLVTSQGGMLANKMATDTIKSLLGYNPFNVPDNQIVDINGKLNPDARLLYPGDLDWGKASTRNGLRQDYALSVSGGHDFSDYFASIGYVDETGYTTTSDFKRLNARINANTRVTNKIKFGVNLYGSTQGNNQTPAYGTGYVVNPFYFSRAVGPIYPVHKHDAGGAILLDNNGNPIYDDGINSFGNRPFAPGRNVVEEGLLNENYVKGNTLGGRSNVDVSLLKELKFTANFGIDAETDDSYSYLNPTIGDGAPSGSLTRSTSNLLSNSLNQLFNYNKSWSGHTIEALLGHESYSRSATSTSTSVNGQVFPGKTLETSNFTTITDASSGTVDKKVESYLSRVNYDFNNTYFLSGSLRRDGNSSFEGANRWANFWSVGGAWRINKEKFFNVSSIDELKFKASYGKVGNDAVGSYPYQGGYVVNNNAQEPGYIYGIVPNPNLTWESLNNLNLGVDFSLFKSRLSGYVQYFNKVSSGLIFAVPQPLSNGGTPGGTYSIWQNIGSMYNRGVELSLTGTVIKTHTLSWQTTLNAYSLKNRITKMPATDKEIITGTKKLAVGHSIYDYWLPGYRGVDPTTGDPLFELDPAIAYNSQPLINYPDRTIEGHQYTVSIARAKYDYQGSAIPKVSGSWRNDVQYKSFTLGILCTYQIGGLTYDGVYANLMSPVLGQSMAGDITKRWQHTGDQTNIPRLDYASTTDFYGSSSRWLISATSLTINNVNIGYTVNSKVIKRSNISGLQIYLSVENAYQFSARKGMNVLQSFNGTTSDLFIPRRVVTFGTIVSL